jgi:hypothetical protein
MPNGHYGAAQKVTQGDDGWTPAGRLQLFKLSEDTKLPAAIRDFCLDVSLIARGIDTGSLRNATKDQLFNAFEKITSDLH